MVFHDSDVLGLSLPSSPFNSIDTLVPIVGDDAVTLEEGLTNSFSFVPAEHACLEEGLSEKQLIFKPITVLAMF